MSQTKKDDSAKEIKFKDIQDTLQKENSILEEMLNETENMHLVFLDRDFNFVRVNEAYAKTCGYKPEEMIGKNHFALYPDEEVEAIFKRVRDTGVSTKFHDRPFVFPDQRERGVTYWDWTLKPVKNEAGEVEGLVFSLVETTERKKSEAELEKSESLYKTLFEKTNDAFQLVEPIYDNEGNAVNYRIIEVNDSYESQVGIKASAVEGKLVTEIDPNIEKNWIETHAAVAKTGNSKRTVIYNGFSKRWYDLFLFPYGKGLVGVLFRDITERKKAEETIREDAQLYWTLFENTEDGFQVVEPIFDKEGNVCDFRYLAANPAFERQVGIKRSEILGKTAKQVFPTIENYWIEMYSKVLRERKTLHYEDYFDSVNRWYHLFYFLFPSGKIGVLFRDITERKKTEEALRQTEWVARQRAEELENLQVKLKKKAAEVGAYAIHMEALAEERAAKLKNAERLAAIGTTAAMVGHDLRNPLQSILNEIYLGKMELNEIPEGQGKTRMLESLKNIESEVSYMDKIVRDLQDYTKKFDLKLKKTNLERICQAVLLELDFPENVKAKYVVMDDARYIVADSVLLKRILQNLVSNAVQAMPDGGELAIEAVREGDGIIISVEDSGVGVPKEYRDKLFTPLFSTKAKGQGFGLPVVKRITEALGGTVTFESEEGKGTKFTVRLPITKK